jgi:murein DD-endopeptidase MepM/ murein hydrolase activator NlpD
MASVLAVVVLLGAAAPAAGAAGANAQGAANGGGVSASDRPPPPAATGGAQAGKVPARTTRLVLARAARNLGRRALRRGSRGPEVKTLQLVLTALGYRAKPTAFFGQGTEYQVKRFQSAWRIDVIGVVGPATGSALRSALQGGKPPAAAPTPAAAPVNPAGWAYPVRGTHNYGNGDNRYGAPRTGHTHAGQDIMSPCGTPLAAARGGTVLGADYGGDAGNYVAVHTADTRYDYFYAHLRAPALVKQGATVQAGQIIGYVGDTGDAVGCHLHFELWDGGWWNGGHTVDPLPFLQSWEGR